MEIKGGKGEILCVQAKGSSIGFFSRRALWVFLGLQMKIKVNIWRINCSCVDEFEKEIMWA